MLLRREAILVLALAGFPLFAQDADEARAESLEDVPCVIDAQLSMWLALESVDRTIASLEAERRDLAQEMASTLQALDVLSRADDPDGVGLAELATLAQAKAIGRGVIQDTYAEIQNRLIEIDKTLTRRREQQAMLESRLEEWVEATAPPEAEAR